MQALRASLRHLCRGKLCRPSLRPNRSSLPPYSANSSRPSSAWREVVTAPAAYVARRSSSSLSTPGSATAQAASIGPRSRDWSRWRWMRALGLTAVAVPACGAGLWIATGEDPHLRAKLVWTVPVRLGRDVITAAAMISDYYFSLRGLPVGSMERERAKRACHARCADRLQALFFSNGGIYIKLGQHIGQLDFLLPSEYVLAMRRSMLHRCPTSSYQQVCEVFKAEMGKMPLEVFAEFEAEPLASASLAQVHRARTHQGRQVAVKVQHGHLTDTAAADTATVRLMVLGVHWLFPSFDYRWLIEEVEESLPRELDFLQEASNAQKCAENFAKSPALASSVVVPAIHWDLCTRKLLTMEFMDGVGVTDMEAIRGLGLRPANVAKLVSEAFAEMIFHHGFVHCDPHAANLMVRVAPSSNRGGRPSAQLVLLDHGLYRTLTPSMREHYAELWKALVFADVAQIQRHSVALGAGEDLFPLFAAILTLRPWDRIADPSLDHLQLADTPEEREQLQMYAKQYVGEISELLRRLPRVVLLLLKTNDCLRAVDNALGAPVNTFVIIARQCTRALFDMRNVKDKGIWRRVKARMQMWHVEFRLFGLQAVAWMAILKQRWDYWLGRTTRPKAPTLPEGFS